MGRCGVGAEERVKIAFIRGPKIIAATARMRALILMRARELAVFSCVVFIYPLATYFSFISSENKVEERGVTEMVFAFSI